MHTYVQRNPIKSKNNPVSNSNSAITAQSNRNDIRNIILSRQDIGGKVQKASSQTLSQSEIGSFTQLENIEKRKSMEARVANALMSNLVTEVGDNYEDLGVSVCNPRTGNVDWSINRTKVPRCMWICAEVHEKKHVRFQRSRCKRVGKKNQRFHYWVKRLREALREKNTRKIRRARIKMQAASRAFHRASARYERWFHRTCLRNENRAYTAGLRACSSRRVIANCRKTGEMAKYRRLMSDWRSFRSNAPNCKRGTTRRR